MFLWWHLRRLRHKQGFFRSSAWAPRQCTALARLLSDGDAYVRMCAAEALGRTGDPTAAPQLIAVLESEENEQARRAAAEAVQRLTEAG